MKHLLLVLAAVSIASVAAAQPIHGATPPATYLSVAEWLKIDDQCHWDDGTGISHTHLGKTAPLGAEISGPITFQVFQKLYHTAGHRDASSNPGIVSIYAGVNGQARMKVVMDSDTPMIGDLKGLVEGRTALVTVDPSDPAATAVGIPKHGWFNMFTGTRTALATGDELNNESWASFYSTVDPSAPEAGISEDLPGISSRCNVMSVRDAHQVFGQSLIRIAQDDTIHFLQDILRNPIVAPQLLHTFSYNYGPDPNFPAASYHVIVGADYHMGIAGTEVVFKSAPTPGGTENFDYLDPVVLLGIPAPPGLGPRQQRVTLTWDQNTGPNGFTDQYGGHVAPNERLVALMSFIVTIGANPVGCTPATCAAAHVPPPVVTPPPVVVPPPVLAPTVYTFTCTHAADPALPPSCTVVIK